MVNTSKFDENLEVYFTHVARSSLSQVKKCFDSNKLALNL